MAMRHSTPSIPMPSPTGVVDTPVTLASVIAPAARNAPVNHSGVTSAGDVGYVRLLMESGPLTSPCRPPPEAAAHLARSDLRLARPRGTAPEHLLGVEADATLGDQLDDDAVGRVEVGDERRLLIGAVGPHPCGERRV